MTGSERSNGLNSNSLWDGNCELVFTNNNFERIALGYRLAAQVKGEK